MYNAVSSWIRNNLMLKGESDQEFDYKLRKTISGYSNNTIEVSGKQIINMDVEIGGKRVTRTFAESQQLPNREGNVPSTNEKGDVTKAARANTQADKYRNFSITEDNSFTHKSKTELTHKEMLSQECTQRQIERLEELKRERGQNDENAEVLGIPLPFRSIGERSSLTDLHNLLEQCPEPQPPLINKQLKTLQLNAEQAVIMAEQVKKMRNGMERLQEIIKKFNCTEKFKQDIDFIIANVGPAIARAEETRKTEQALCKENEKSEN